MLHSLKWLCTKTQAIRGCTIKLSCIPLPLFCFPLSSIRLLPSTLPGPRVPLFWVFRDGSLSFDGCAWGSRPCYWSSLANTHSEYELLACGHKRSPGKRLALPASSVLECHLIQFSYRMGGSECDERNSAVTFSKLTTTEPILIWPHSEAV